ncbi:hypothetical protein KP509_10G039900 [Ceratopteris richardii]|uniref:Uncharacterized protein n=1 Tax=Ceratopteris richardii TaxID=49495 RepID=A0A8T2U143_CERRI|nr:hypothetical protein KP509_10G039900 [Ceratopteris richardii]
MWNHLGLFGSINLRTHWMIHLYHGWDLDYFPLEELLVNHVWRSGRNMVDMGQRGRSSLFSLQDCMHQMSRCISLKVMVQHNDQMRYVGGISIFGLKFRISLVYSSFHPR